MQVIRFTLVADGSSDRALLPVLVWLLREHFGNIPIQPVFSDLRRLRSPPGELFERIAKSVALYPCDLLFVHRDAELETMDKREEEIRESLERSAIDTTLPVVCVIPVRMQETWLLIDESALRRAAGNPLGRRPLLVPDPRRLEDLPDPKQTLHELLRQASDLHGRRLARFNRDVRRHVHRLAQQINDFRPLRRLSAFQKLEHEVIAIRQSGALPALDGVR